MSKILCKTGDLFATAKENIKIDGPSKIWKEITNVLLPLLPYSPTSEVIKTFDLLSTAAYEQSECEGKTIIFVPKSKDPYKYIDIPLSDDIKIKFCLENIKVLRKLINPLASDCAYVFENDENGLYYAIGSTQIRKLKKKLYYKCEIIGQMKWKLSLHCSNNKEKGLFGSVYSKCTECNFSNASKPNNLSEQSDYIKLEIQYKKIAESLIKLVDKYVSENKNCGTSFVIFDEKKNAVSEAKRLASDAPARGYLLNNSIKLTYDNLKQIMNIDGGMIVDTRGNCHAYGCIFDGKVYNSFSGDRSVGARHNSMKLYVNSQEKGTCVGIVFSEDGGFVIYSSEH